MSRRGALFSELPAADGRQIAGEAESGVGLLRDSENAGVNAATIPLAVAVIEEPTAVAEDADLNHAVAVPVADEGSGVSINESTCWQR